jgi:hypothetical protein
MDSAGIVAVPENAGRFVGQAAAAAEPLNDNVSYL